MMGGIGSGRPCTRRPEKTAKKHRFIDVRQWHREGMLESGNVFLCHWLRNGKKVAAIHVTALGSEVELQYQLKSPRRGTVDYCYTVELERTPCHLGGERTWFRCPTSECNRRVAILYLSHGRFACRHCLVLGYQSQRETEHDRHIRRANKLRRYMGWPPGILNLPGVKPKGMHWKTYDRLLMEYLDITGVTLHEITEQLQLRKNDV